MEITNKQADLIIRKYARLKSTSLIADSRIERMRDAVGSILSIKTNEDIFSKENARKVSQGIKRIDYSSANNNWIEWKGGNCPIDKNILIETKLRSGAFLPSDTAENWYWEHDNTADDIIAYRAIAPELTLEEFCVKNALNGNLDILTPGELTCLYSEFYELNKNKK